MVIMSRQLHCRVSTEHNEPSILSVLALLEHTDACKVKALELSGILMSRMSGCVCDWIKLVKASMA